MSEAVAHNPHFLFPLIDLLLEEYKDNTDNEYFRRLSRPPIAGFTLPSSNEEERLRNLVFLALLKWATHIDNTRN